MIPVEFIQPGMVKSLKPLTYFESGNTKQKSLLVCGTEARPIVITLAGERKFQAQHRDALYRDIQGIAIQGIQLEVDPASGIYDNHADAPTGSLAVLPDRIEVEGLQYSNIGVEDQIGVLIAENSQPSEGFTKAYFTRWALVRRDDSGHLVWRYEVHAEDTDAA